MSEQASGQLVIGRWRVDVSSGEISDGRQRVTLRPREMDVLRVLARADGAIVSVEDLLRDAWHGTLVSNDALYFAISQLRKALDNGESSQSIIETVPKRGYRLTVAVSDIAPATTGSPGVDRAGWFVRFTRRRALAGAIVLAVLVAAVWRPGTELPDAPAANSIAVMPFVDLTPASDHTYFSDGITEEILNGLARVPGLQVAARTSSFVFKDQPADVVEIGRALGVASLLEGSVRRDGDRMRIAVQLIDARTGFQLWSESYDREVSNVFALQNEISQRIIGALQPALLAGVHHDAHPAARTPHPGALDLYLLGLEQQRRNSFNSLRRAVQHYRDALAIDPSFAHTGVALADTQLQLLEIGASVDRQLVDDAEALVADALASDPGNSDAHRVLGQAHWLKGRADEARASFEQALQLSPSNSIALVSLAELHAQSGRISDARAALERALRIDPLGDDVLLKLGHVHWSENRLEDARATWVRGTEIHPRNPMFPAMLGMLQVLGLGELAGGLQNFLQAAALDPADYEIAAYVAMSYLSLDMPEAARPWIDRAVRQAPLAASSPALESAWLAHAGDTAAAASLSANMLAEPRLVYRGHKLLWETHYVLAMAGLLDEGKSAEALQLLKRNAAMRAGRQPESLASTDEVPDLHPNATRLQLSFANAYRAAGQHEHAVAMLEQVKRPEAGMQPLSKRGPGLHLLDAEIRALRGDSDGALDLLEQVAEIGPVFNWQVMIAANSSFDDIRATERFNEVLDTLEATAALQRQRLPAAAAVSPRQVATRFPAPGLAR